MKSSTKGFLIGLVCGAILLVGFQVFSLIGFGLLFSSGKGKQWMANLMLSSPRFPDTDSLSDARHRQPRQPRAGRRRGRVCLSVSGSENRRKR